MISVRVSLLLLLSRGFYIFQIADVHLLHSATWWRLLGQKYLLTAEVTRLRLRGERLPVWCGNEIEPRYLGCYNLDYPSESDGLGFLLRRGQCREEDGCQDSNNGDDNEQFDRRKSLSPRLGLLRGFIFSLRSFFPRRRFLQKRARSTGAPSSRPRSPDSCRWEKRRRSKRVRHARATSPPPALTRGSTA